MTHPTTRTRRRTIVQRLFATSIGFLVVATIGAVEAGNPAAPLLASVTAIILIAITLALAARDTL